MAKTLRTFLLILPVLLVLALPFAATAGRQGLSKDSVTGLWYTEDKDGGIELYPCKDGDTDRICGRFYWLQQAKGEDARDTNNPDPDKRSRPLCHMQFMGGFTPEGDGRYSDGWIYSPRHGEVFDAEITMIDRNTIDLHGYIITPILGDSQTWKRAEKLPDCAPGALADIR